MKKVRLEDIYIDVAKYLESNSWIFSKQIFLKDLETREELGCIKVDENFYLPHLVNNNIKENIVVRVDDFEDDVLFILIKENDKEAENKARNIVRNLLIENKRNIILKSNKKNLKRFQNMCKEVFIC